MKRIGIVATTLVLVAVVVAVSQSRAPQSTPQLPTGGIAIPFELVNRHIVLDVMVGSRSLSFIFDTGDKFAIIDTDQAKELGLKRGKEMPVRGSSGAVMTAAFLEGANFSIPGLKGFSQPLTLALPVKDLSARLGHDLDGIIGADFISQFVVEVDYQARVLRLHDRGKFKYTGTGEIMPIHLNPSGHPVFEVTVTPVGGEPITGQFALDIGSGGGLELDRDFAASHHMPGPNVKTVRELGTSGAGGRMTGRLGRVAALQIGRFKFSNPIAYFSDDDAKPHHGPAEQGSIGQRIAGRFKIYLDYSHDRIIFEPNAAYGNSLDRVMSGLFFVAEGKDYKTFRVTAVLESSPATEAGLQKDDIILAIDDRPAAELTVTKIVEMLERPVARKFTVVRARQTVTVTLKPRQLV